MGHTYCMTSNCPLAEGCARYEDDAGQHCLQRTYADFSEELIRHGGGETTCPFYLAREASPHPSTQAH